MAENSAQHFSGRIIDPKEIPYYHELGLGRGLNVAQPNMWKNKTPYLVREACEENISGTKELQMLESYKKEVPTFNKQQQEISFSLDKPRAKQIRIEMDEEFSRGYTATKIIEGRKIETRTISFQFHFNDVPLYDSIEALYDDINADVVEMPDHFLQENESNWFEKDLADWLLKCIKNSEGELKGDKCSSDQDSRKTNIKKLADKLATFRKSPRLIDVLNDCKAYIELKGITHYVSAIRLGAYEWHTINSTSEHEVEQTIGGIDTETEEVTKEEVIGFEIQPLYKLVRIPVIQMALKTAIKLYLNNGKLFNNLCLKRM